MNLLIRSLPLGSPLSGLPLADYPGRPYGHVFTFYPYHP